jgi:hypothetical protein
MEILAQYNITNIRNPDGSILTFDQIVALSYADLQAKGRPILEGYTGAHGPEFMMAQIAGLVHRHDAAGRGQLYAFGEVGYLERRKGVTIGIGRLLEVFLGFFNGGPNREIRNLTEADIKDGFLLSKAAILHTLEEYRRIRDIYRARMPIIKSLEKQIAMEEAELVRIERDSQQPLIDSTIQQREILSLRRRLVAAEGDIERLKTQLAAAQADFDALKVFSTADLGAKAMKELRELQKLAGDEIARSGLTGQTAAVIPIGHVTLTREKPTQTLGGSAVTAVFDRSGRFKKMLVDGKKARDGDKEITTASGVRYRVTASGDRVELIISLESSLPVGRQALREEKAASHLRAVIWRALPDVRLQTTLWITEGEKLGLAEIFRRRLESFNTWTYNPQRTVQFDFFLSFRFAPSSSNHSFNIDDCVLNISHKLYLSLIDK